jgi:hypothetical protein
MKTAERERLLHNVLCDETYDAFRAELRQTLLAEVRRTRRRGRIQPLLALAACVTLVLGSNWLLRTRAPILPESAGLAPVRTVPLRADQIVTTAQNTRDLQLLTSRPPEPGFAITTGVTLPDIALTDDELLKLFEGRPVALVSYAGGKKLVLLDEPVNE